MRSKSPKMLNKLKIKPYWLKIISVTLLLSILSQLFSGTAYALTSGPTAPEATSFEPVDTTDIVNPLTGDFTYNLPLLEVPGPEGGYPLSLSYHAGIQPNEDASWVGLGWTLNPGAINRSVNGFPDDWYNSQASRRDYWEGGKRTSSRIGISIPILSSGINVGFGLSFSNDTYKGSGVGFDASVGFGIGGAGSPFAASIGFGVSADTGDPYVFGGLGASSGSTGLGVTGGIGFSTDFHSPVNMSIGGGLGYGFGKGLSQSLLGISLSSNGKSSSVSLSAGGISASTQNSNSGAMTISSSSFSVDLLLVSYSRSKTRYWSNESAESYISGALYGPSIYFSDIPEAFAYDGYNLQEENKNIVDYSNPGKQQGGAFPNFDSYQVTAQGLGGSMRPYQFKGDVVLQEQWEMDPDPANNARYQSIKYVSNDRGNAPQFRFENDFSNNYLQSYPDFPNLNSELYFFDSPYGNRIIDDYNYNISDHAIGSRSVRYFSVGEVNSGSTSSGQGFIYPKVNFANSKVKIFNGAKNTHIAGFAVTNTNGLTYHYNLPAYSYGEEIYQEKRDHKQKLIFNRQSRDEGYAYTWYLTAITGPDYVDRGEIGVLDAEDYGYWTSFDYGKWAGSYVWRNPSEASNRDDDNEFSFVSMGKKEVYYLNSIRTRTHTAIFVKSDRADAKGASPEIFNKNWDGETGAQTSYQNSGVYNINSAQSMRLDKIYLFNNADASVIQKVNISNSSPEGRTVPCSDCEIFNNVYHKSDIQYFSGGFANVEAKSLRIIDFNYDYNLAKGTVNSFESNSSGNKLGKLTLNSVEFRGTGGSRLLPPVKFDYELNSDEKKEATGTLYPDHFESTSSSLEIGDMLHVKDNNNIYCGAIVSKQAISNGWSYGLRNGNYGGSPAVRNLQTTKNPPYNKDATDMWGMYKSDYSYSDNETLSRTTTATSSKAVDAWSLRKVTTSLGAELKIKYEGDSYNRSVLNRNHSLIINNFTNQGNGNFYFDVEAPDGLNLFDYLNVGGIADILLMKEVRMVNFPIIPTYASLAGIQPQITNITGNRVFVAVSSTGNNQITTGFAARIVTGNIKISGGDKFYGGDLRVKSIIVDNLTGVKNISNYSYTMPLTTISSGLTSYEPIQMPEDNLINAVNLTDPKAKEDIKKNYRRSLYNSINPLMDIAREIPGPGVMYEYVTTSSQVLNDIDHIERNIPVKTESKFEIFRENMVGRQDVTPRRSAPRESGGGNYYTRNMVLKKFLGNIGSLKKSVTYNVDGSKLNETINHYLHDGLETLPHRQFMLEYENRLAAFKKQGLLKERYSEKKSVWTGNGAVWDFYASMSAREEYPSILIGQTVKDYSTRTEYKTENLEFDFYSGNVTKKSTTDSYGNGFMEEIVPAYRKYYALGPKTNNGKNMLDQVASYNVFSVDGNKNKLGLISATANFWSASTPVLDRFGNTLVQNDLTNGVWRSSASYNWLPEGQTTNGLSPINSFSEFDWSNPALSSPNWKKTAEISLFDVNSKPLETKNIHGQINMTKYGYANTKPILTGGYGNYDEFAFSGAEDMFLYNGQQMYSSNVKTGSPETTEAAHTGKKSLMVYPSGHGFIYSVPVNKLDLRRNYAIALWVKPQGEDISGAKLYYKTDNGAEILSVSNFQKQAAGWYLLEFLIPSTALIGKNSLTVGCLNAGTQTFYADDFRFQPFNAGSTAYVYDDFTGELTYILGNNNLFIKYRYDNSGRVIRVYQEVLGKTYTPFIKKYTQNYGRDYSITYSNNALNLPYTSKICPANQFSEAVYYQVPAGKYTSKVSQQDADEQAMDEANIKGQIYANENGNCVAAGIYVKLCYENTRVESTYSSYNVYANVVVRFYKDVAATIPLSVNNLQIKYAREKTTGLIELPGSQIPGTSYSFTASGFDYIIASDELISVQDARITSPTPWNVPIVEKYNINYWLLDEFGNNPFEPTTGPGIPITSRSYVPITLTCPQ